MRVEWNPETLSQGSSGAITGSLWVRTDDIEFPERDWSDFVPTVLRWWMEALSPQPQRGSVSLLFMDGPFEIRLTELRGLWTATFVTREPDGIVHARIAVDLDAFTRNLRNVSKEVVSECSRRGWTNDALSAIGRMLKAEAG